jgi:hypothetical protein
MAFQPAGKFQLQQDSLHDRGNMDWRMTSSAGVGTGPSSASTVP